MEKWKMRRLSVFLAGAALILFLILDVILAVSAHVVTVHEGFENYPMNELVVFWRDNVFASFAATVAAITACMALHVWIEKGKRIHLKKILFALWTMAVVFWVWGAGVAPRADSERVVNAALMFARGDYSPMRDIYFNDSSYQLGICFVLEVLCRLMPRLDIALLVQVLNALMCVAMSIMMAAFAREMGGKNQKVTCYAMYLLFLPMPFYCTYVYGTIPMMMLISAAFLMFARYAHQGGVRYGLGFSLCMGFAAVMKPNAMIAMLALVICVVLYAMNQRDWQILLYAVLSSVLCVLMPRVIVWQYELRSGCSFSGDLSMLARLVMGFQRSATGAGWFNNYIDQFSTWLMEPHEANAVVLADLKAIFAEFAKAPMTFVQFMAEKCASMWLEPTYSVLWHGAVSDVTGRFNGLANMVYLGALRMPVERIMDAFQQAMYVLVCIGVGSAWKRRHDPVQILLPVTVLGGFLYHALFEAKSQYIFVYAFFMMPIAAQGLCVLEEAIGKLYKKWRKAA